MYVLHVWYWGVLRTFYIKLFRRENAQIWQIRLTRRNQRQKSLSVNVACWARVSDMFLGIRENTPDSRVISRSLFQTLRTLYNWLRMYSVLRTRSETLDPVWYRVRSTQTLIRSSQTMITFNWSAVLSLATCSLELLGALQVEHVLNRVLNTKPTTP